MGSTEENASTILDKIYCCEGWKVHAKQATLLECLNINYTAV